MRVAYVVVERVAGNHGVPKKFAYQLAAWRKAGATCELFAAAEDADAPTRLVEGQIFHRNRLRGPFAQWKEDRRVLSELVEALDDWKPDLVYLRWGYHKPEYIKISDRYPTIIEINGDILETAKLRAKERKGLQRLLGFYVQASLPSLLSRAAGFIAVTHEVAKLSYLTKYGTPVGVYPNSIDLAEYSVLPFTCDENELPRIVFIGNFAPWHGLDRVVELGKLTEGRLEIDIIGCDAPRESVPSNVTFHGYLKKEDYSKIFAKASVGLDGLALFRKRMDEACPLKIREYLACGLPFILSARDTAFFDHEPDWILRIGNSENSVKDSVEDIVSFANQMKGRRIPHQETSAFIDSNVIEGEKVKFFKEILDGK